MKHFIGIQEIPYIQDYLTKYDFVYIHDINEAQYKKIKSTLKNFHVYYSEKKKMLRVSHFHNPVNVLYDRIKEKESQYGVYNK